MKISNYEKRLMKIANISEESIKNMATLNPDLPILKMVKHLGNTKYYESRADAHRFSRSGYVTKEPD